MRCLICLLVIGTASGNVINQDQNLCNALALSTGTIVTTQGNNFIIQGSQDALEGAYSYFQDPKAIRRDFLPPSQEYETVKARKSPCERKLDFFEALGLDPADFASINVGDLMSANQVINLPFSSKLNKRTVANFEEYISSEAPLVKWFLLNEHKFKEVKGDIVSYNFGIVQDYLCGLPSQNHFQSGKITLPRSWVIKHLIAATSGDVSLVPSSDGNFKVRTMHMDREIVGGKSYLDVDIRIDRSISMYGNPIALVNSQLPKLFEAMKLKLGLDMYINIEVFGFNSAISSPQSFTLSQSSTLPRLYDYISDGYTDLRFIGTGLNRKDNPKILIAFTDGQHTAGELDTHYKGLEALQKTGDFAFSVTSFVGTGQIPEYLMKLARMFGGKTFPSSDVNVFFEAIRSAMEDLLTPMASIVFTLNGVVVSDWVQTSGMGISTSTQQVSNRDIVVFNGIEYIVDLKRTLINKTGGLTF